MASIDVFTQFAVPMFILISGIVLSLRYDGDYSIKTFYKKRINRILIPYLIWSLIYIAVGFVANQDITATEIIFKLFTGSAFYHLWFFLLIFQLYLFFPFYRKLIKGKSFIVIVFVLILQIVFNHFKIGLIENKQLSIIFERLFLSHIFYFSLGIWIADNMKKVENLLSKLNSFTNLFFFLVSIWASYIFSYNWLATNNHFFEQLPILMIIEKFTLPLLYVLIFIVLYYFASKISSIKVRNHMGIISKYSFGIYLSHAIILLASTKLLQKVDITYNDTLYYILTFTSAIILSYIFCYFIEKTKLSKYLLGIRST